MGPRTILTWNVWSSYDHEDGNYTGQVLSACFFNSDSMRMELDLYKRKDEFEAFLTIFDDSSHCLSSKLILSDQDMQVLIGKCDAWVMEKLKIDWEFAYDTNISRNRNVQN